MAFHSSFLLLVTFVVHVEPLSICSVKRYPISFAAFDSILAERKSLHICEFIFRLLSAVTLLINIGYSLPFEAIHSHAFHHV